jgi:hypothetical protein
MTGPSRFRFAFSDKPVLVDPDKLREIISGLELKDAKTKEYIEARWLNYVR